MQARRPVAHHFALGGPLLTVSIPEELGTKEVSIIPILSGSLPSCPSQLIHDCLQLYLARQPPVSTNTSLGNSRKLLTPPDLGYPQCDIPLFANMNSETQPRQSTSLFFPGAHPQHTPHFHLANSGPETLQISLPHSPNAYFLSKHYDPFRPSSSLIHMLKKFQTILNSAK